MVQKKKFYTFFSPVKTTGVHFLFSVFTAFVLITSSSLLNKVHAQDWGLSAGVTMSSHLNDFWFIEDDIQLRLKPDIAVGYHVGLISRVQLAPILRLQAEPSIVMLGARYDDRFTLRGTEFTTDSRTELTYITLPLVLQLTTTRKQQNVYGRKQSFTTFHLSGGAFGGYLLDAQFEGTNSGAPIGIAFEGEFSNDVISQYSEYDAGVIFGLGLERGHYRKMGFETRAKYSVVNSGNDRIASFKPQNMAITFTLYFIL